MASEGEVIIRNIMTCVDAGDVDGALAHLAEDFSGHYASTADPLTREAMSMMFAMFTTAFPHGSHRFDGFVAEGDCFAFRAVWRATETGAFQGLPPTGNMVEIVEMAMGRVENGKLAELWMLPDQAAMMQQLSGVRA